jgi:hypothetical protein
MNIIVTDGTPYHGPIEAAWILRILMVRMSAMAVDVPSIEIKANESAWTREINVYPKNLRA